MSPNPAMTQADPAPESVAHQAPAHQGAGPEPGSIPAIDGAPALVEIHRLSKSYRGLPALSDLSLTLPAGRITGLMGANGCGKTTLLKILAGVLADYEGTVHVAGQAPGPESKAAVSFLPDASFLDPRLNAARAIAQFTRLFADFDAAKARRLVEFFDLPTERSVKEMSKGMGEKLRIALAMSRRARVYLLDEPISGVDPAAREVILNGILRDFDPEALMLISTHLIADVEPIIDSAVFLKEGRLLLAGDADDLRETHGMGLDALFRKEYR
ncbi:ABC-type transporter ATP-binding protein EcsA [Actinomyces bovis]|uniref:ABC-type transporter ATP-binding protein EcsA n=1 Tax=Actinomyces bovis TaxID=1658 RepID=A0ABY1VLH4_9ACTO|nr:ABC transporter ATP-binding protein [Actinomyces bovis]SPT52764.1 ABC-type transporter ATP-binding protein EcsA [Actinomyces bovis]VEG54773.1 ABC-type transporter ATP-binding protein EcsA [Actinomyces israelii]